jgi:hypothetical protein
MGVFSEMDIDRMEREMDKVHYCVSNIMRHRVPRPEFTEESVKALVREQALEQSLFADRLDEESVSNEVCYEFGLKQDRRTILKVAE